MRIFSFDKNYLDKRYIIAFIIVILCGTVCGIVLFNSAKINSYLKNFAQNYINNVYSFKNVSLIFPRLFCETAFCYLFYFLGRKTTVRFVCLPVVFLRALFIGLYTAMLFSCYSFGGAIVALLVYIPMSLVSLIVYFACSQLSNSIDKKYRIVFPLALVLACVVIQVLLVNVAFRIIIIIV